MLLKLCRIIHSKYLTLEQMPKAYNYVYMTAGSVADRV